MRVLVTGGAGFIGSHFIRYVLNEVDDVSVVNLDALTYAGNLATLHDVESHPRYRFVHGDIGDAELVDELVADADAVVNFAAETHVDRSITGPAAFLRTNVTGAGVLFDAGYRHGVERFLHISTDEVYGSVDAPGSFVEGDALAPNSPYSASKAGADLLARAYQATYGYPITVTRTVNNFGPYQYPEKVVPRFVTNLLDGETLPLYGEGRNVRDWLYVEDNVAAQWLVLTHGQPGEVYNVGAGNELTNRELTDAILGEFGLVGEEAERHVRYVEDRAGHDLRYSVDSSKVRALGWSPRYPFAAALSTTADWYRQNEDWWRSLTDGGPAAR